VLVKSSDSREHKDPSALDLIEQDVKGCLAEAKKHLKCDHQNKVDRSHLRLILDYAQYDKWAVACLLPGRFRQVIFNPGSKKEESGTWSAPTAGTFVAQSQGGKAGVACVVMRMLAYQSPVFGVTRSPYPFGTMLKSIRSVQS